MAIEDRGATPSKPTHLATKNYVDTTIPPATQSALNTKQSMTLLAAGATSVPAGSPTGLYFFH